MGANRLINPGVVKGRPQILDNKIDKELRIELLQIEVELFGAVVGQPIAQLLALKGNAVPAVYVGATR